MPTASTGLRAAGRMRLLRQQLSCLHQHNSFLLHLSRRRFTSSATPSCTPASKAPKRGLSNTSTAQTTTESTTTLPPSSSAIPLPATIPHIPLWQRLGPLTWAIQGFGRSQRKRPYVTQFVSTLVIYFLGDLSAQGIRMGDERGKAAEARHMGVEPDAGAGRYEPERTAKALVIGAGSSIPTYLWFIHLSTHYNYPSLLLSLATKVTINQLLYTPFFNSYFFGMQSILTFVPFLNRSPSANLHHKDLFTKEGVQHVVDHVTKTVPTSFVNSCKLWPAVTAFNFWIVPIEFRAVSAGIVAVGWQTYLSFLNRRVEREEEKEERKVDVAMMGLEKQGLSSALASRERGAKGGEEKK